MKDIDPKALFRLSVLGPLVSRERLERGELQQIIRQLAQQQYAIPGSRRRHIGEKTLQSWYYAWKQHGLEGLCGKPRVDRGQSKLPPAVQAAILAAKRENPRRSIRQIRLLLESAGIVAHDTLSRCALHRLLQAHGLSRIEGSASLPEEKRSFVAEHAGSIWYGDVLHGPHLSLGGRRTRTYLVSLMDDASRLIAHSAFCCSETAVDIEGVLKQALLKRGVPRMLIVDNGAAYRASTLQSICARLSIKLVYCRPYAPEGKGKLERWHRSLRDQFLSELDTTHINDLADLNARLWAWVEQIYHRTGHSGLGNQTPLARYQQDLPRIRTLGTRAAQLDELFLHRVARYVRRDGTVSFQGKRFEVPYELAGKTVLLVVDPHTTTVVGVESEAGEPLGAATVLDAVANLTRRRRKPQPDSVEQAAAAHGALVGNADHGPNLIELAYQRHYAKEQ
jgi:transposase InsO family protein